jgi:hypothetical protein
MRMMLKVVTPVEAGNAAVKEGVLKKVIEEAIVRLKPEASYFFPENGCRTAMMVFDLANASDIPSIAEPFFMQLNAAVTLVPVMNAEDLGKGLAKLPV